MFVDMVSSEYDGDPFEEFRKVADNHDSSRQMDVNFVGRKALEFPQRAILNSLTHRDIKPMLQSCSASYKQNPDGSWEVTTNLVFTNSEPSKDESSGSNDSGGESSSCQETTVNNVDPPASNDPDKD